MRPCPDLVGPLQEVHCRSSDMYTDAPHRNDFARTTTPPSLDTHQAGLPYAADRRHPMVTIVPNQMLAVFIVDIL